MYAPLGHDRLRASLRRHTGSYALLGPSGVGKRGIVSEWLGSTPHTVLGPDDRLDGAATRRDLVHVIDAAQVRTWIPLLRPLEEGHVRVVVIAEHDLPAPVATRLPLYRAGLLTEIDVTQILARDHPRLSPRPVIARIADGSLDHLDHLVAVAQALPDVQTHLSAGTTPDLRRGDPLVVLDALRTVCRAVIGLPAPPVSDTARAALPARLAHTLLNAPAWTSKHEARNALVVFFARLHG